MTDFEKYPKYLLNKHGKVIQNILSNAEAIFNLDANPNDPNDPIKLQAQVMGGENLRNAKNAAPIFENAIKFHTDTDTGVTSIGLTLDSEAEEPDLLMAIANFADEAAVSQLFNTNNSSEFTESLPTPAISFSADYNTIKLTTEGDSLLPMYYLLAVTSYDSADTEPQVNYYYFDGNVTELPLINPIIENNTILQLYTVSAIGDSFNTSNSTPSNNLQKLFLAAPKISFISESGDSENEKHVYKVEYIGQIQPDNITITSKYHHTRYNYSTHTVTTVAETIIEPEISTEVTLQLGDTLTSQTSGTATDDTIIINSATTEPKTLYKQLTSAPNPQKIKSGVGYIYTLLPDQYRNDVAYIYTDIDGTEKVNNIIFTCRVKKAGQADFGQSMSITADCQLIDGNWKDESINIRLDIGDILEVSALAASFFYSSDTATIEVIDDDPGEPVIDITTAKFYEYQLEAGWSQID